MTAHMTHEKLQPDIGVAQHYIVVKDIGKDSLERHVSLHRLFESELLNLVVLEQRNAVAAVGKVAEVLDDKVGSYPRDRLWLCFFYYWSLWYYRSLHILDLFFFHWSNNLLA